MAWPERLYAALLRLYPREFRDEYAREMAQVFRDRMAGDRGVRLWSDTLTDVALTAPREHAAMLLSDIRYAGRLVRRAPFFTTAVVLTLALGIGAATAIFSVVNTVLLRPLPFAEPGRLMQLTEKNDRLHLTNFGASVLNYLSWKEQTEAFAQLGAIATASFNMSGRGDPEQYTGASISPSVMPVLGLRPVVGRSFRAGEDAPGAPKVAIVSEGVWKRRFGGDPALVGQNVTLNGVPYTIVGVAPTALTVMTTGDVWVPLTIDPGRELRLNHVLTVIGRLKAGVSLEQARGEMDTIAARVGQQYPEVKDWGITVITFYRAFVSADLQTTLLVLMSAVGLLLLITCANVANLLLARASSRQREVAVRTAIGASRGRILHQLLVESLVFSLLGGALGLAAAFWGVGAINRALPPNVLPVPAIPVDGAVLAFALGITFVTGLLFGSIPAWHAVNTDLNPLLTDRSRGSGSARRLVRNLLAAAELALATALLIGAGLLIRTLVELEHVHVGFKPDGLLTFQISLPRSQYGGDVKAAAFYARLREEVEAIPGVTGAGVSSGIPFGAGNYTATPVAPVGPSALAPDTSVAIDWRIVSPGFFRTMNIPMLEGRDFNDGDRAGAPPTMVVSQATARRFWGNVEPIGRTIRRVADGATFTVVGVVGDVRHTALNQESPAMYYSIGTRVWPLMDIVVRTERPDSVVGSVRQAVRQLDPELPLANVRTMEEWMANSAAQPRLNAILLASFAAAALLLAAIGIYGVIAYSVSQRTQEIGLRMALGAERKAVVGLVVREGMTMAATGVAAGLVAALALSRALASLVFGVTVRDPATFGGVAVLLSLVAAAACALPARRATQVDPMIALRHE